MNTLLEEKRKKLQEKYEFNKNLFIEIEQSYMSFSKKIKDTYFTNDPITIKSNDHSINFFMEDNKEQIELFSLKNCSYKNGIYISYHSTNVFFTDSISNFELTRLELLGRLAKLVKEGQIVKDFEEQIKNNSNLLDKHTLEEWDLRNEVKKLEKEERETHFNQLLKCGIFYEGKEIKLYRSKTLYIRVTKINILKISNKTVKIEYTNDLGSCYEITIEIKYLKHSYNLLSNIS